MNNMEPVDFAGSLFRARNGMWPKPLIDALGEISLSLPIRFFLILVRFIYKSGTCEVIEALREVIDEEITEEQLLAMTESQLQTLSRTAWICGGKVHLERRGVSRLYGALAYWKRNETNQYLLETVRGVALLADSFEGEWNKGIFSEAVQRFKELTRFHL